ncbi:unnamed protein product [Didymodactylos carnosus]|uniref:ADP ribosyltransferase domain-containing protein n=1 Tax=Didymodactylos carnosus TaxID=1234261 RepID=A0A815UWR9_9BILA|nr:unnamed protein product [Didymodactylos carnosus]CAF1522826.1 unnamed protein product [Didymodactylos carnosus]CAF4261165.1 unnamed protein product [Didymodactylos carnosus]CAF4381979.1 unnamed protein product [Didymodactylos carnosus]
MAKETENADIEYSEESYFLSSHLSKDLRIIHRERFLYEHDEISLSSCRRASFGSAPILQWCYKNGFDFDKLMKKQSMTLAVLKYAVTGIEAEGKEINQLDQAKEICDYLSRIKQPVTANPSDIGRCCVYLYTKDTFLYKRTNELLRQERNNAPGDILIERLAPYCALLSSYLQMQFINDGTFVQEENLRLYTSKHMKYIYRGSNLSQEMIEQYKQNIGKRISWPAFSSMSKSRRVAELFGNTLFMVDASVIKSISTDYLADIEKISAFPEEQEVLLTAGINLEIRDVKEEECEKYTILVYLSENHRHLFPGEKMRLSTFESDKKDSTAGKYSLISDIFKKSYAYIASKTSIIEKFGTTSGGSLVAMSNPDSRRGSLY